MRERYELAMERINQIREDKTDLKAYQPFFCRVSDFLLKMDSIFQKISEGKADEMSIEELETQNREIYSDILPDNYSISYANPAYAIKMLGKEQGCLLSFLYTELRAIIPFVYEENLTEITIRLELFLEVYSAFCYSFEEEKKEPDALAVKDIMYWFVSDYSDVETERRIREQVDSNLTFAVNIICKSDRKDLRYLYAYGEYVSDNERKTAEYINSLPEDIIEKMAATFTEGFLKGFEVSGKDLSKKETVNIRYCLGFERVIERAIVQFEVMGLKPVIYRAGCDIFSKRGTLKIGYYGAIANRQYEYDHREDLSLFLDGHLVTRKLECLESAYEEYQKKAAAFAGPACMEVFGETPFTPKAVQGCAAYSSKQQELVVEYTSQAGEITNRYIRREERSFTIIAFPTPAIGKNFEMIFDEVIRINTLDYQKYAAIQQTIINTLDLADYVEIVGYNDNVTRLKVALCPIKDGSAETKFENCVADVNIPVGEVFTSPRLNGTEGILHVTKVFLNDLEFKNLKLTFQDGIISDYSCSNFDTTEENRAFIEENLLFHHKTLPMGEFAIGTNTTAYVAAKKYGIEDKLPILIAEKMGPHFAVGDTCYSNEEEIKVYNPDGKEMIAKENSFSKLRDTDLLKAYFHCHTDITIPYDELYSLSAHMQDGTQTEIIKKGRFVLDGCEALNEPFA